MDKLNQGYTKPKGGGVIPKLFYIFCEGAERERRYFECFENLDNRISLVILPPSKDGGNTSPLGLKERFDIFFESKTINSYDEVWFVFDTDDWGQQITDLRAFVDTSNQFYAAQSNPCFEVWLYYHFFSEKEDFHDMEVSSVWKPFVDGKIPGGFDSRVHPFLLASAIANSEGNYLEIDGIPDFRSTQLHFFGTSISEVLEPKISAIRTRLKL